MSKSKTVKVTLGGRDFNTSSYGTLRKGQTYEIDVSLANYMCNKRKDATFADASAKTAVEKATADQVKADEEAAAEAETKRIEAEAKAKLELEAKEKKAA